MVEQILLSVQMYVLTLVMTPFGFVVIPQGIGMLKEHIDVALVFYAYLLVNPVLFRLYLNHLNKRHPSQHEAAWSNRKQWIRGLVWAFLSHLIVYEMIYFFVMGGRTDGMEAQIAIVGLSSIALVFLGACTGFLSYKHGPAQRERRLSHHSPISRG